MDWKLVAKYISNECDRQEKQQIENRIQSDPEFAEMIRLLEASTRVSEVPARPIDVEAMWNDWQQRTLTETNRATIKEMFPKRQAKPSIRAKRAYPILRIAAMLILTFALSYLLTKGFERGKVASDFKVEYQVVKVENCQRTNLVLPDGSQVTVDAGSEIKVFNTYRDERHVFLKGEACFTVARDSLRPFYVHAGHAVVRVVGTRFNVRAWEINPTVVVTVAEGTVAVSRTNDGPTKATMLTEGQQSKVPLFGAPTKPIVTDVDSYFNWMKNEIHFEQAKVREIVAQLHRWYDYEFEFQNQRCLDQELSVHIYGTNVNEVIEVISLITETKIIRAGNQITFIDNPKK